MNHLFTEYIFNFTRGLERLRNRIRLRRAVATTSRSDEAHLNGVLWAVATAESAKD